VQGIQRTSSMPEAYQPLNFFSVAFRVSGSAVPAVLPRSVLWTVVTALPSYLMARFEVVTDTSVSLDLLTNFMTRRIADCVPSL
jgi:hypothetical protein